MSLADLPEYVNPCVEAAREAYVEIKEKRSKRSIQMFDGEIVMDEHKSAMKNTQRKQP